MFTPVLALALLPFLSPPPAIGRVAPTFRLPATDGRTYDLADYRGQRAVVLIWYAVLHT
jgi:thioredoxin-dependent peroxiredoxin